ncbi:zinc finger protein zas1 [Parachaetomium inaequale]|uniref:Zinc finger protein zas1 n=1 Tax=Parachaetomium inaequale TaxID=2588326 RepID=A0AAN6SN72_9PEZI|nr:zinc finger protein zas1 [Parachaetomium inaequale]
MPHFPEMSPQDPVYDAFGAEGLPTNAPTNAPPMLQAPFSVALGYPPMGSDFTSALNGSPVEPFTEDADLYMAFQTNLYTESTDLSWAVPPADNTAAMDPFSNTLGLDTDLFSGLDFDLWPKVANPYTPPGSASPATPVYDTMFFPVNHNPPPSPLTPVSQPRTSATPESASPAAADPSLPQTLPCSNASCPAVFPTLSALRKHERKHRTSFHCPIPGDGGKPPNNKRCTQGFLDARALHRHLWTQHKEYARAHNLPSEQVRCPVCAYTGRGDNVARHVRQRHGEGGAKSNSNSKGRGRKGTHLGGRGEGGSGDGLRAIQPGPSC